MKQSAALSVPGGLYGQSRLQGRTLRLVSEAIRNGFSDYGVQVMDEAEKVNEALLDKMAADSEGDLLSAAEAVALNSREPEVLRYIVESIMEDEEGNPENAPFPKEHIGTAFLHLKIVLDAFIEGQR